MHRSLCTVLLWFIYLGSTAQILKVMDAETKASLEYAHVYNQEEEIVLHTNMNGEVDISILANKSFTITFIGYYKVDTAYSEFKNSNYEVYLKAQPIIYGPPMPVTATRRYKDYDKVPARVSAITLKDVQAYNPQTTADLLSAGGEVFVQKSQQGGGSPMIRGFSTNRLLYVIDGVRMNTAIFRSGNLQNVIALDAHAIERTEVFFGPGSVIYGSDAIGGVMNFQTLTAEPSYTNTHFIKANVLMRFASANNENTLHADLNIGTKNFGSRTSLSYSSYGELQMGSNGPDDYLRTSYVQRVNDSDLVVSNDNPEEQIGTSFSQMNLMQKFRFRLGDNWNIRYGFHYSESSDIPRYDRLARNRNGVPRDAEWNYGPQVWTMNALSIERQNSDFFLFNNMSLNLAHQYFEESRITRAFNDPERNTRIEKVNAWSANLDFEKVYNLKQRTFYGIELVWNDVNSEAIGENILTGNPFAISNRYPDANWTSYAAFLIHQYDISDKITAQAGMRYNLYELQADFSENEEFFPLPELNSSINNGSLTGSLGLTFRPNKETKISLLGSTGFRAPNVDDIGKVFDSEPGSVVVPNPELEAEYAYNAEIGFSRLFCNSLYFDVNVFYTILENAMVRRDATINGQDSILYDGQMSQVQSIQNAANATVYGLQAGINWSMNKNFNLYSKFNYQNGEEEMEDGSLSPSRHAAPWFGRSGIVFKYNEARLEFCTEYSGEISFENLNVGEQGKPHLYASDENGNPYSPGWYTLNFKLLYPMGDVLQLSAGIENLTDQRYRTYSSGIASAGRNFIFALRMQF